MLAADLAAIADLTELDVLAAVFVAEIGDVHRFPNPRTLCSWAGLTPRHRESDVKIRRGRMTKQGPVLVRWAAVEAATNAYCETRLRAAKRRVGERRGSRSARSPPSGSCSPRSSIGLRDGEIRSLQDRHQPTAV
ncbi:MAG: IS110 family transposase [Acidimicrobiia bacterium]|nr:IS110 family transposase [Acidimicrobiia bacterium]